MERNITVKILVMCICALLSVSGCAPISEHENPLKDHLAGTAIGGAAGVGVTAALHAPAPVIGIAGVAGASLGYYLSSQRFAAGGLMKAHGKVYTMGDYVIIDIPTDNLFDINTADFYDNTDVELQSIVSVLKRVPDHNIIISGNTSGFNTAKFDNKLSQERASKIASYLWLNGINDTTNVRRLIYVGYGDSYPIANDLRISGIRANSRIQIIAYPCAEKLHWDKVNKNRSNFQQFKNIGSANIMPPSPAVAATTGAIPTESLAEGHRFANTFSDHPAPADAPVMESKPYKEEPSIPYQEKQQADATPIPTEQPSVPYSQDMSASIKDEFEDTDIPTRMDIDEHTHVAMNDNEHNDIYNAGGVYNSAASDPQTLLGVNSKKHWGFKGDNELKDETPAAPPTAKG